MIIRALAACDVVLSAAIEPYTRQRSITPGHEYQVHALFSDERGFVFVQFVDDMGRPDWLPSELFEVIDHTIPLDWKCNVLSGPQSIYRVAIGPAFVVDTNAHMEDMIQRDASSVDLFWKRVDSVT